MEIIAFGASCLFICLVFTLFSYLVMKCVYSFRNLLEIQRDCREKIKSERAKDKVIRTGRVNITKSNPELWEFYKSLPTYGGDNRVSDKAMERAKRSLAARKAKGQPSTKPTKPTKPVNRKIEEAKTENPDFLDKVTQGLLGLGVSSTEAKRITSSTYCQNRHKNATDLLNDCLKKL